MCLSQPFDDRRRRIAKCQEITRLSRNLPGSGPGNTLSRGETVTAQALQRSALMKLSTLRDLYLQELKDLYSAEKQLVKALPKMALAATSQDLKAAFEAHLLETKEHVTRLERVLSFEGASTSGPVCKGMAGLVAEGAAMIKSKADPEVRDAGLIAAAQRVEHYELAGYGCVRAYARLLNRDEAVALLQKTLDEEGAADKKLTELAMEAINTEADHEPEDGAEPAPPPPKDNSKPKTAHTRFEGLKGKRVLVTGGTTGIGRAIALRLSAEGARVMIFGRHQEQLDDALRDLKKNDPEVVGMIADTARPGDLKRVFKAVESELGGLDILINNAGVSVDGLAETPDDEREYGLEVNISGYLRCCKLALDLMDDSSHIVLIGSVNADDREPGGSIYVATKAAIQAFSESFRQEAAEQGVKVSLVQPGKTGSDMLEETPEEQREGEENLEILKAEDIAVGVEYILTQPRRCTVSELTIRPALEQEE